MPSSRIHDTKKNHGDNSMNQTVIEECEDTETNCQKRRCLYFISAKHKCREKETIIRREWFKHERMHRV